MGLYAAIQRVPAEDAAAFVQSRLGPSVTKGHLSWDNLAALRRELGASASGWEQQFFDALGALARGSMDQPTG